MIHRHRVIRIRRYNKRDYLFRLLYHMIRRSRNPNKAKTTSEGTTARREQRHRSILLLTPPLVQCHRCPADNFNLSPKPTTSDGCGDKTVSPVQSMCSGFTIKDGSNQHRLPGSSTSNSHLPEAAAAPMPSNCTNTPNPNPSPPNFFDKSAPTV